MKIADIELINLYIPLSPSDLPKPVGRYYGAFMLVRIKCDNGLEGMGEGYSGRVTSATAAVIRDTLTPILIGQEAIQVADLYERMYRAGYYFGRTGIFSCATSAVEMALWDIAGKHFGAPVYALLGGRVSKGITPFPSLKGFKKETREALIPAYASMQTFGTPEEVAAVAKTAVVAGFKSIKLHQVDIASVKAVRETVGEEIEITVDANGFFNPLEALRFARTLADYNVAWLEEPIWPPDDYRALAELRRKSPLPIAGGELESGVHGFERIFETNALDILQPEVLNVGGILESFKVYSMAQGRNIPIAPHNFKYGPLLAATLHLSVLFSNVFIQETPWFKLEANLFKVGPGISNGYVNLADSPGLGIVVDEDVVKDYRVDHFPPL